MLIAMGVSMLLGPLEGRAGFILINIFKKFFLDFPYSQSLGPLEASDSCPLAFEHRSLPAAQRPVSLEGVVSIRALRQRTHEAIGLPSSATFLCPPLLTSGAIGGLSCFGNGTHA